MEIEYSCERKITSQQFIDVLVRSTLAERRPVHDRACIADMLTHANLTCTAWHGDLLIGIARSLTDFSYCCYCSDLAVDVKYQKHGIGKKLIQITGERLQPQCKIILLAAPKAEEYYPKIGFSKHHSAWVVRAGDLKD